MWSRNHWRGLVLSFRLICTRLTHTKPLNKSRLHLLSVRLFLRRPRKVEINCVFLFDSSYYSLCGRLQLTRHQTLATMSYGSIDGNSFGGRNPFGGPTRQGYQPVGKTHIDFLFLLLFLWSVISGCPLKCPFRCFLQWSATLNLRVRNNCYEQGFQGWLSSVSIHSPVCFNSRYAIKICSFYFVSITTMWQGLYLNVSGWEKAAVSDFHNCILFKNCMTHDPKQRSHSKKPFKDDSRFLLIAAVIYESF